MNQQTDKYIKYLNKLVMLDKLRDRNLISESELISIKRHIRDKHKIRDYD